MRPKSGGWIERDASTGRAMLVEAVRDGAGRAIPERDGRAATAPRTRFALTVAPAIDKVDEWQYSWDEFWSNTHWEAVDSVRPREPEDPMMWVKVRLVPSGKAVFVACWPSMTVLEMKAAVAKKAGLSADNPGRHKLVDWRVALDNARRLSDYGVQHKSSLFMVQATGLHGADVLHVSVVRCGLHLDISVPSSASVSDLKARVAAEAPWGTGEFELQLQWLPFPLPPDWLVAEVVYDGCPLVALSARLFPSAADFEICVKTLAGRSFAIAVSRRDTIKQIKYRIQDHEGFSPDQQRLLFAGNQLQDELTIADYHILSESTLHLIPRLRGGGGPLIVHRTQPVVQGAERDDGADSGPLVARVVSGALRRPPATTPRSLRVLMNCAAPRLVLEVSVLPTRPVAVVRPTPRPDLT
ncbi:hypothetical protein ONE63_003564 [Megalurothrips usitatus]|uniref:Ubiquitin-like domain-containing protein n=1 Tax=Megalurothrips usitatus TaxID=439358 RepID=A0AAV7X7P4_9NEOP|nr:hypothetical protein ONE63_003564 [Megalurothrips usitatus]